MVLKWKWFILCLLFIGCFNIGCPYSIAAQSEEFPIGLELVYQYTHILPNRADVIYEIQFEVLRWASGMGSNIAEIRVTTTGDSPFTEISLVHTLTWETIFDNGTSTGDYLRYPLWYDTSTWGEGGTIQLLRYSSAFRLAQQVVTVPAGTYSVWRARWEVEEFALTRYRDFHFERQFGVFIKQQYHSEPLLVPRYHSELTTSNLAQFGLYPIEFYRNNAILLFGIIGLIVVLPIVAIYYIRRKRGSETPPELKPRTRRRRRVAKVPKPPAHLSEEIQPEEPLDTDSPLLIEEDALSPCIVCRLPIKSGTAVVGCPHCGGFAHRRHLLEWIKVKGRCPYCHKKIKKSQLTSIDV